MEKERYWTFLVYPESVEENWINILSETGLVVGISPLHDKDKNNDMEESQKKPHYHVLICFNGPTTYKRVAKICESIKATIPKRVLSPIGIIRYFTHKDNPEKYQYEENEIRGINGFDYKEFIGLSATQENAICIAVCKLIKNQGFKEYTKLVDYLIEEDLKDMFDMVKNKAYFFSTYITSKRHMEEK